MAMDLDLLHIKLTAYALGELDASQKAEIERVLAESQDARDQVMRAKGVAKAIKELLPQMADDVQPMTPGEYLARRQGAAMPAPSAPARTVGAAAAPVDDAPAAAGPDRGNGLVWLLALVCVGLVLGLAYNWKTAPPAPPAPTTADAGEIQSLNQQLANAKKAAAEAEAALAAATETNDTLAGDLKDSQDSAADMQSQIDALETARQTAEQARTELAAAHRHANALSLALANHHPFTTVAAQVLSTLPASASSDSVAALEKSLAADTLPLPDQIDPGELVQGLTYTYASPPPGQGTPLVTTASATCPWAEGHVLACIAVSAGSVPIELTSVQTEFNPAQVGHWRLIGHENHLPSGAVAGGQGVGTLPAGATMVALYEIIPATDPLAPLLARRTELTDQLAQAKQALDAAPNQAALAEAQFNLDALNLNLADLDKDIAKNKSLQLKLHYSLPSATTPAAANGDWLTTSVVSRDPAGKTSTTLAVLNGAAKHFPEADANFRLAATTAALGLVLRESPARGSADMALVASLIKDLPATHAGVKTLQGWVRKIDEIGHKTDSGAGASPPTTGTETKTGSGD